MNNIRATLRKSGMYPTVEYAERLNEDTRELAHIRASLERGLSFLSPADLCAVDVIVDSLSHDARVAEDKRREIEARAELMGRLSMLQAEDLHTLTAQVERMTCGHATEDDPVEPVDLVRARLPHLILCEVRALNEMAQVLACV